ncbi:DUF3108 domain-containing protein [Luteimonas viscosa]|uniref:DUF3108 domain-containing protein n=1 Tax=Luteimonas viscosa TaxID=1132694 RepID=A0A5D4XSI2_9GAMM|nr:DUF3108 domain-containing protein [Luteimonas viscosa]TYT26923.1 DUF3108 domain-containing protein [Luteimonas viscosa]
MLRTRFRTPAIAALLALASAPLAAIEPFTADYGAQYMGMQADGRMTLAPAGDNRWKYSLEVTGAGARLAQSTVFEATGGQWRPLSGNDSQGGESGLAAMLVKKRSVNATYDWDSGKATWDGDVKPDRRGPVKLQAGDVDGMLMNLALVRDFKAGKPLSYRLVEDGRVKRQAFRPAGTEDISVAGKTRKATKVTWKDDNRSITAWIVDDLPVPARILQQRDGRDHIDLQLKSLH